MPDFTFAHTSEGFDNHIDASIRHYSSLVHDVVKLSRFFIEDGSKVYDLGCSTGKMLRRIAESNADICPNTEYIGLEHADGFDGDMANQMSQSSFKNLHLRKCDVRDSEFSGATFITSIFTLQFIPRADRLSVLRKVYSSLEPGGAFVFAEKTYAINSRLQDMLTFIYYDHKATTFSSNDIIEKERTLRAMLRPNSWNEIVDMLTNVGFDAIQPFWQNHLFVGAICVK